MARKRTTHKHRRLESLVPYLNLAEMREFCRTHDLPLMIHVERPDGTLRRSGDRDRKDIVLERILQFALHGRRTGPTIYAREVVREEPLPQRLTSRTQLHYNQYEKKNPRFLQLMAELTDGAFRTGMIARLVLRDFWTAGKTPTLAQFASAWRRAHHEHVRPRPEGAYLVDRWKGEAGSDWKKIRIQKASQALELLQEAITARSRSIRQ